MTIIRPDSMPRFWWLVPWAYARQLHRNANALRALADRLDEAVTMQSHIISDQSEEIANLRQQVTAAERSREHWIAKHDQAYAVAMHNERVIARLEESIIGGHAIIPDPKPIE
jgi:predicted  nucleic acid-binding Zn-ribbon protein